MTLDPKDATFSDWLEEEFDQPMHDRPRKGQKKAKAKEAEFPLTDADRIALQARPRRRV